MVIDSIEIEFINVKFETEYIINTIKQGIVDKKQ